MSSVVAGFETAVLECAGHLGGAIPASELSDDAAAVVSADTSVMDSTPEAGTHPMATAPHLFSHSPTPLQKSNAMQLVTQSQQPLQLI